MTPNQILKEYLAADKVEKEAKALKEHLLKEAEKLRAISGKPILDINDDYEIRRVSVESREVQYVSKPYEFTMIKPKKKLTPEESLVQSAGKGKYA